MQAVILAGGLGTRLRDVIPDIPKPMADVAGHPFLEYLLRYLGRAGYRNVVLCLGYRADVVRAHFGAGQDIGLSITYSVEPQPLGTGGALKLAEPLFVGDRWLIMNGDSFLDISITELVARHIEKRAVLTLALTKVPSAERYGRVLLDEDSTISGFFEKGAATGPALVNAGMYVMQRSVLDIIPPDRAVSLERDIFPSMIGRGLCGVEFSGTFVDIGTPGAYRSLRAAPGSLVDVG